MYLSDYHFHTQCSTDSTAPLAQQAQAAMAAGVREICVTDHWNLLDQQGNRLPTVYDWSGPLEQLSLVHRAGRSRLLRIS